MLTSQNVFIANLALSDLLLCTLTMPLTLLDLLTKYWPLGPNMDTVRCFNCQHYVYLSWSYVYYLRTCDGHNILAGMNMFLTFFW